MGALKSGAGLVSVATPASSQPILAAMAPEYMTDPLVETADGAIAAEALEHVLTRQVDVIACGPGLGLRPAPSRSCAACCSARACRWCWTPMR